MDTTSKQNRWPWLYVPTLYFAEGFPYVLVNVVSVIMYKTMGVSNTMIGLTSMLYLPWIIKPLWGPLVEMRWQKRKWIQITQIAIALLLVLIALTLNAPQFFLLSMLGFILLAFTSATHDIAIDGFYMQALSREKQAFFVGVRSTFYRLAMIFGSGVLVVIAGTLEKSLANTGAAWSITMLGSGILLATLFVFHSWYLPHLSEEKSNAKSKESSLSQFLEVFRTYFQQPHIGIILAFILLYRLGEAMLVKMAPPFLLDAKEAGGLALSTIDVGFIYGTVGTASLVAGGILGGWLIAKFGLRKCIWPMALALNVPNLIYVYLAHVPTASNIIIQFCIAIEQLGYGIGFSSFLVFLMYTAKAPYQTAHYAISTGFMAIGMLVPGLFSGYLQSALGYQMFFNIVCLLALPGMATIFFIPFHHKNDNLK